MPRLGVTEQTAFLLRNVEDIARSLLAEDSTRRPRPSGCRVIVVLMGLPGVGKSHFGRILAQELDAVVVASDALRRRLFVAPSYGLAETRAVFALAHAVARALLSEGHTVIFDATNLIERDRLPLYALARDAQAGVVLVRVTAAEAVIHARLAGRLAQAPGDDASEADARVYELMRERFEAPARPYLTVDTGADLAPAARRIAEAARAACP
jgi:predicted kinase